jgi:hypothetical protein
LRGAGFAAVIHDSSTAYRGRDAVLMFNDLIKVGSWLGAWR